MHVYPEFLITKKDGFVLLITGHMQSFFLHKKPVYKRLDLGWKIPKQLSGLNAIPLSNNKNDRFKEKCSFFFSKYVH